MTLAPMLDRVIVEPIPEEEVTAGGVIIPENARDKSQRGTVIAVGPGARNKDGDHIVPDIDEGDIVVYSKYGGSEIRHDLDDYLILREPDILAVEIAD